MENNNNPDTTPDFEKYFQDHATTFTDHGYFIEYLNKEHFLNFCNTVVLPRDERIKELENHTALSQQYKRERKVAEMELLNVKIKLEDAKKEIERLTSIVDTRNSSSLTKD